jgi:SAM-dependent methyltransferase
MMVRAPPADFRRAARRQADPGEVASIVVATFEQRRARRALVRQLAYQREKARTLAGRAKDITADMQEASAHVRTRLELLRPIPDEARVLEVGSGAHGLIFYFGTHGAIGVDPLAHHYASLFSGWQSRVRTVSAFGEALPFADNSFDLVLCDNVVDHAESPARIVSEMARVLVPGGLLYFTVNVHHPFYSVASDVHAAWHRAGIDVDIGPFADHTVHLTLARARALFTGVPLLLLVDNHDIDKTRERERRSRPRHAGNLLKRVFFKNARYEAVAIRV